MPDLKKNPPVPVKPAGACIQFGGDGGFHPVGQTGTNFGSGDQPVVSEIRKPAPITPERIEYAIEQVERRFEAHRLAGLPASPRSVLQSARARIKELRRFLRQAEKAKKELAELERLVAAATGKPLAAVRDIRRSAG